MCVGFFLKCLVVVGVDVGKLECFWFIGMVDVMVILVLCVVLGVLNEVEIIIVCLG